MTAGYIKLCLSYDIHNITIYVNVKYPISAYLLFHKLIFTVLVQREMGGPDEDEMVACAWSYDVHSVLNVFQMLSNITHPYA